MLQAKKEISGRLEEFKRWKCEKVIPSDVLPMIEDRYVTVFFADTLPGYELENWSTHRESVRTRVLSQSGNYIVFCENRCTVRTNEESRYSESVWCLAAKPMIETNMEDADGNSIYVEFYGELPTTEWLSPEFLSQLRATPRKVWDHWGNELPSDTKLIGNYLQISGAFKTSAASKA